MKKELEKEIRIYKKNEEALYDMFALDEYSKIASSAKCDTDTLIAVVLFEKLIKDFSDEEVTIPFSFQKSKGELLDILNEEYYKIYKKYKNIDNCEQLLSEFKEAFYKERITRYTDHSNNNFNFVKVMMRYGDEYIFEFLLSDITIDKKINLFFELFSIYPSIIKTILEYFEFEDYTLDINRISMDKIKEPMKNLIEELKPYVKQLYLILSSNEPKYIAQLQDKCFDFNPILFKDEESNKLISSVVHYYRNFKDIECVGKLYESESYSLISKDVKENNDEMLINSMFLDYNYDRHHDLLKLISFRNFEVTEAKLKQIANELLKEFYVYYDKASDEHAIEIDKRITIKHAEDIKNCIIRKTSNKNEFKKYKEYSDLFMQFVSNGIETYINNKNDELAKSRKHLYRVLLETQKKVKEEYKNNYETKDNDKANKKLLMSLTVDELVDKKD